jgi:hypothetical protein
MQLLLGKVYMLSPDYVTEQGLIKCVLMTRSSSLKSYQIW